MILKTFRELRKLETFEERYRYLKLGGVVGNSTFGFDRHINQMLYTSREWSRIRDEVIVRDNGCDLGVQDYVIRDRIIVHHMNPINVKDIEDGLDVVFDTNFLICTTHNTHLAIHYGDESLLPKLPVVRSRGDTTLWR
jgi:hypothetical protein